MKFSSLLLGGLALAAASSASASLILTEVVDGDLSGGNPKFVEITNVGSSDYTFGAGGGLYRQFNGGSDADGVVSLDGTTISAGQSFVIVNTANGGQSAFENTYGFAADLYTGASFGNGDDAYWITDGSSILDIFGEVGLDGTGKDWEYTDGFAARLDGAITPRGTAFEIADWTVGKGDLDASSDSARTAALLANTTPGFFVIPEPSALALVGFAAAALVVARRRRA